MTEYTVTFAMIRSNLSKELDFGQCLSKNKYNVTCSYDVTAIMSPLLLSNCFDRRYSENNFFNFLLALI